MPPLAVWFLAFMFLLMAVMLTPENLIRLGPMRASLTAPVEQTRTTAELTVLCGRWLCGLASVLILALGLGWRRITQSKLVAAIIAHRVPDKQIAYLDRFNNTNLWVGAGGVALGILWLSVLQHYLPSEANYILTKEDGIFEQVTAFFFLCAGIVGFMAVAHVPRDEPRRIVWLSVLSLFFLVCCGEEISWGQRMFGFETPDALKKINVQDEANLHNVGGYLADHLFIAGVLIYGAVLPLLAWASPFWRRALDWLGLPIASAGLAISFLLASSLHDWSVLPLGPAPMFRVPELREMLSALCLLLLAFEALNNKR